MIEDYFDYSPEYEDKLRAGGKEKQIGELRKIAEIANITFLRQHEAKGLGHAIYRARSFTGDEPFAVLYGDDIIFSETPVCAQLISAYEKYGLPAAGIKDGSLRSWSAVTAPWAWTGLTEICTTYST